MGKIRSISFVFSMVIALLIVIAIYIPYSLLISVLQYNKNARPVRITRVNISDIYDFIDTGDILLFTETSNLQPHTPFVNTYFTHIGILIRDGDIVCSSEAQPGLELMPDPDYPSKDIYMMAGVDEVPLLTRIKYHKGKVYIMRISQPINNDIETRIKKKAFQLLCSNNPYPTTKQAAYALLGISPGYSVNMHNQVVKPNHCFQHVAHILDAADLAPVQIDADGAMMPGPPIHQAGFTQVCRDICNLPGKMLWGGYSYDVPLEIVYDIGAIKITPDGRVYNSDH